MKLITIAVLICSFPEAGSAQEISASTERPWSVKQLVEHHLSTKKNVAVRDVYKMLYHAHFGVEHLLTDTAGIRSYLLRELGSMSATPENEPLAERISTTNTMVRINLRPFTARNLDPELLVKAMFASAAETTPDTFQFRREWNMYVDLVRYGFLDFPMNEVHEVSRLIEEKGIVPVHHSEAYREANHPAYRVVQRRVFERLFGD
ncbi:MAG: hypothetical protein KF749_00025 [Bacteroidetes bacterium]|nr:hypothetical protein [Bacteroidota bacterium]MCW5897217.1 hypothetical protein [Bacteroidota bacterium]